MTQHTNNPDEPSGKTSELNYTVQDSSLRPIPFNQKYRIDTHGTIYSKRFDRPLKQFADKDGYMRVSLAVPDTDRLQSKTKTYRVHRLVATTFMGESDLIVNHKNGIRSDNRLGNLEYVTQLENIHKIMSNIVTCPECNNKFRPGYGKGELT